MSSALSPPVENIPAKVNAVPVVTEKCSASSPEWRSPSRRNRVHLRAGMPFGFPPEPRSGSTGFITDVEHGSIMALNPTTNQLSKLGGSKDIVWPDGIVLGGDGDVYFTDSSIPSYIDQIVRPPTKSKLLEHRPYFIYRLKKSRDTASETADRHGVEQ